MDTLPRSIIEHFRHDALMVDDEWSEDLPDGFRWWPTPQSQRVFTDASYKDEGETLHRIVVETDVVALTVSGEEASVLLAPLAGLATLSGLVLDESGIVGEDFVEKHGFLAFNEREISAPRGNFLGSWCPGEDSVQFVTFVPNALYCPNVITNFFYFGMGRARFVSRWLLDDDWSNTWDAEGRCRATRATERAAVRPSADDPQ